ncbi:MAG: signal peptide peptidase SppA [Firmicutes bacterium]|nr:signal peptide peptidase SppA [Bacillota bacterium]
MKKKQIIGIVVAGVMFIITATASTVVNQYIENVSISENDSSVSMLDKSIKLPSNDFIGVVNVNGTIVNNDPTESALRVLEYDHDQIIKYIDDMEYSNNNKGLLLVVDSPGGTVYASDELYLKLKEYKDITGRPIWTYMKSYACSGGYYISMASDKIFANRNTWTGSIGVIISTYNLKGLFDEYGIQEINITSGPNKAMGAMGEEMTDERRAIFQSLVDESYEQFVSIVANGRNMSVDEVKTLADGRIYTAQQAVDNGLIDGIDSYEQVCKNMLAEVGDADIFVPSNEYANIVSLFGKSQLLKKSETEAVLDALQGKESEVMYYAEGLK